MTSKIAGSHPSNPTGQVAVVADPHLRALSVIDAIHQMFHQGRHFVHSGENVIANAASLDFLFLAPPNTAPHLRVSEFDATSAPIKLWLYEGPTVTSNGTPLAAVNNNRLSSRVAGMQLFLNPAVTAAGLHLRYKLIPGSKQSGGDGANYFNEWILKPGVSYLFRVTNVSGGESTIGHNFEWYEPAPETV